MQAKNSIDIMLPYWGEFSLLKAAIDSVMAQTTSDWRLVILDDHYPSTEARDYVSHLDDKRIHYIRHPENIGITNNFNYAVQHAKAPYCVILGCDDILLPTFIETALKNIGHADFYQPYVEIINRESAVYLPMIDRVKRFLQPKKSGFYSGERLASSLCIGNWLYFPSIVWKSETIQKYRFDPSYKITEDVALELSMIKDGAVMYFDRSTTFQYRRFADSLSSKEKKKGGVRFDEETKVYKDFAKIFDHMGWKRAGASARLHITSRIHHILSSLT